ncbi:MAG: hypothetical protein AAGE37_06595 [Pseudomonadota bacterium]
MSHLPSPYWFERQAPQFTTRHLLRNDNIPLNWGEQQKQPGFV